MRITGTIEFLNGMLHRCDICKRDFEVGDELSITFAEKDSLGWNVRKVRHKGCKAR